MAGRPKARAKREAERAKRAERIAVDAANDTADRSGVVQPAVTTEQQTRATMRTRYAYSDADKLKALTAAYATNPEHYATREGLEAARAVLGAPISKSTLSDWNKELGHDVRQALVPISIDSVVIPTQTAIVEKLGQTLQSSLAYLNDGRMADSSARDLAVISAIVIDKIERVASITPAERAQIDAIRATCQRIGVSVVTALEDLHRVLLEREARTRSETSLKSEEFRDV